MGEQVSCAYDSSGSGLLGAMQHWRGPALPYDVVCVPTYSRDPNGPNNKKSRWRSFLIRLIGHGASTFYGDGKVGIGNKIK
jgi:hypothetical protein